MKFAFIALTCFFILQLLNNFVYLNLSNGCFIKILPSWDLSFNQSKIKEGLIVLKNALPEDYSNICKRIDTIDPNFDCGRSEGGCYWSGDSKKISVSTANTSVNWIAGVLVHETCHSVQDSEHKKLDEVECHQEDNRVLKSLTVY